MKSIHTARFGIALPVLALALTYSQNATAQAAPSPYTSAARYDGDGRQVGTISPDPDDAGPLKFAAVRNTYDPAGRLTKIESGELATWQSQQVAPASWGSAFKIYLTKEMTYDILDRKLTEKVIGEDGVAVSLTQTGYDAGGRLECLTIRMVTTTWNSLPASACALTAANSPTPDRVIKTLYNAAGEVVQIRKAVGTADEAADVTYDRTANGKIKDVIDANGNRATYAYDGFDRLQRWTFPAASRVTAFNADTPTSALASAGQPNANDYEEYQYDPNGSRTSLRKRDSSLLSFEFDNLNRMTRKAVSGRPALDQKYKRDVFYGYDLRGLQTSARFDSFNGEGIINGFDGFGRLFSTEQNLDGNSRKLSYEYDLDGNRKKLVYPDSNVITFRYDGLDRAKTILRSDTSLLAEYTYDAAGRKTSLNGGVVTAYAYDPAGRLSSLSHALVAPNANLAWAFQLDAANQITQRTLSNDAYVWTGGITSSHAYATNGLNQYTAVGQAALDYDANANLTSDGSSVFTYDIENRLVKSSGEKTASLRYDPMGRLYEVTGAFGTTRWLYDGDALLSEYNSAGDLLRRYVHGVDGDSDDPLAWYEGTGYGSANERRLRSDWQGSVALISDSLGNTRIAANRYDEYGNPQASNLGRFQYTGQAYLPELGLYYYKARIYSPTLGKFLQTDPIGYDGGRNIYNYVASDPVNRVDPTGTVAANSSSRAGSESASGNYATAKDSVVGSETGGVTTDQDSKIRRIPTTLDAFRKHFQSGVGGKVAVDASKLTILFDNKAPKTGQTVTGMVTGLSWVLFGNVSVTGLGNNKYRIETELYNFEQRADGTAERNILTKWGAWYNGRGTPFYTVFYGSPRVIEPQPKNKTCYGTYHC